MLNTALRKCENKFLNFTVRHSRNVLSTLPEDTKMQFSAFARPLIVYTLIVNKQFERINCISSLLHCDMFNYVQ